MIKFKKKTNLKHVQDRLDILEQNIETLNNNILNLEICFKEKISNRLIACYGTKTDGNG